MLTNILVSNVFSVISGFWHMASLAISDITGSATVSSVVSSGVVVQMSSMCVGVLMSDLVTTAASGSMFTFRPRVGMSLHDVEDSFRDGRNVFCQVLLPTILGRGKLTCNVEGFSYLPNLGIISIVD